jgi:hypothetical protein
MMLRNSMTKICDEDMDLHCEPRNRTERTEAGEDVDRTQKSGRGSSADKI